MLVPRTPLSKTIAAGGLYALSTISLLLLWLLPRTAQRLGLEDGPIENFSAVFLFVGSFVMVAQAVKALTATPRNLALSEFLAILAVVFFVCAGEEISWGQRIFGLETGEFMRQYNWQGEVNLHNLQTDLFNTAYHYGAFLFLIILPLFKRQAVRLFTALRLSILKQFIAPKWLAFPLLPILGMLDPRFVYTIEKPWAAALYLSALILGVGLLLGQVIFAAQAGHRRRLGYSFCSMLLIAAGLYVSYLQSIDTMPNTIAEYKELVIAAGLCTFALFWPTEQPESLS